MQWYERPTLTRVRARNGRELTLGFLEDLQDGLCDSVMALALDEFGAIELLKRCVNKRYSFCDALTFLVMEQYGIAEALGFHEDLRSCGRL